MIVYGISQGTWKVVVTLSKSEVENRYVTQKSTWVDLIAKLSSVSLQSQTPNTTEQFQPFSKK